MVGVPVRSIVDLTLRLEHECFNGVEIDFDFLIGSWSSRADRLFFLFCKIGSGDGFEMHATHMVAFLL